MIPKTIHYCWFGRRPLPKLACKCIESWRRFLPDYEICQWNEDNFDVNAIPYTAEAYAAGKYAFVSDYARFKILYDNGGVYFDTDVEVVKPFDRLLEHGPFMGLEKDPCFSQATVTNMQDPDIAIAPGLGLAANPGLGLYKDILEEYKKIHFLNDDGTYNLTTVVQYVTKILLDKGLNIRPGIMECASVKIYPSEYLNPKQPDGKIVLTPNTYSIHHYTASWYSPKQRAVAWVKRNIGLFPARVVSLLLKNPLDIIPRVAKYFKTGN